MDKFIQKRVELKSLKKDLTKLIMLSSGFYAGDDRFPYGPDTFTVVVTPVSESGTLINKACASLSWTEAQS